MSRIFNLPDVLFESIQRTCSYSKLLSVKVQNEERDNFSKFAIQLPPSPFNQEGKGEKAGLLEGMFLDE